MLLFTILVLIKKGERESPPSSPPPPPPLYESLWQLTQDETAISMLIRVRPKPDQPDRLLQPVFMFLLLFRPIGQMGYITHTFMVSMCNVQTGLLWSIAVLKKLQVPFEHWYHPEEGLSTRWKCRKRMSLRAGIMSTVQWDCYFSSKYFLLCSNFFTFPALIVSFPSL